MYIADINKLDKLELLALIDNEGFTNLLDITADHTEDETREALIEALQDHGEWIENYNEEMGYNMYQWFDMHSVIGLCNTLTSLVKEGN